MRIYKVGVVGCGRAAWLFDEDKLSVKPRSHIGAYFMHPQIKVVAVCDTDRTKLKGVSEKYRIKNSYLDFKKMLKNETLDIVSICTPADSHKAICSLAARSGVRAIFCEKPIAISLEEADSMVSICRRNEVKLFINHTRRWDINFNAVKTIIDKGAIGKVTFINAFSPVGFLNSGTHLFDLLRMFFGEVKFVSGTVISDKSTDPGGRGMLEFRSGLCCFVDACWREYLLFGMDIYGERGILRVNTHAGTNSVFQLFLAKDSKKESGIKEISLADYKLPRQEAAPILNAVRNIVNNLENGEDVLCSGDDGRSSLEIALAFHESFRISSAKKVVLPLKNRSFKVIPRETSFTKDGRLK